MKTSSEILAEFASSLQPTDLPDRVVATVKRHLLDTLGVALASASMPFADKAMQAIEELAGNGNAPVIGRRSTLPPAWAALANGTFAHGIDFDDTHTESVVHVSTSVVPAALAAASLHGCDGPHLITALALGMEANIRIGLVARGGFHDRGFHPTGICGTYATALVAGAIAGHDAARHVDALGLAASQAAGSLEFLTDGTWAKRIHGGWAAHAGLTAASLARAGFTGPRGALDGRFGLYRSHLTEECDLDVLRKGLGSTWHLLDTALKPYPCCHFNHAFLDAAAELKRRHRIEPASIERVQCKIAAREMPIVCEPAESKRRPQTDYDAKFSLPYTVACMFARGHVGIDDFDEASIHDDTILELAARVDSTPDPDSDYPARFPARIEVVLRDGTVLQHHEPVHRGSAERPLTDREVEEKFHLNARRTVSEDAAATLYDRVSSLERLENAANLLAGLAGE